MGTARTARRPSRSVLIVLIAAIAVVGVAVGFLVAKATNDDDRTVVVDTAAQAASVQQACQQWLDADPGEAGTPGWCAGMAEWMTGHMHSSGLGPQMMWDSPERMRGTCQQWLTANPPTDSGSTVDPRTWCETMVRWMTEHMREWAGRDGWDEWMMHGPRTSR